MRNASPFFYLIVGAVVVLIAVGGLIFGNTRSAWDVPAVARTRPNPVAANAASVVAGETIYQDKCVGCHGDAGDGRGSEARMYSVKPANFNDPKIATVTDGELFWKITTGNKPMPAFKKRLTEEQRWQVIDFIRTFAQQPNAAPTKTPQQSSR